MLDAISMNDSNSWYYYNMALTYYKLDDYSNACKYINLSIQKGEKVEIELKNTLCNPKNNSKS